MKCRYYDPARRAREKQASRDDDQRAIATGEKTAEEVRQENARFVFPWVRLDFSATKRLA